MLTHTHALSFTRARTLARVYARLATLAWSAPTPFLPDHAVPSLTLPAVLSDGSCPPVSPCTLPWFRCLAFPALLHRYECRRPPRRSRCSDRMYGACMSSFARAHHDDLRKALSPCVDQPFRSMQSEQRRLAVCVRCTWQARSMCGAAYDFSTNSRAHLQPMCPVGIVVRQVPVVCCMYRMASSTDFASRSDPCSCAICGIAYFHSIRWQRRPCRRRRRRRLPVSLDYSRELWAVS